MIVHLAYYQEPYEAAYLVGVYKTKELAYKAARKAQLEEWHWTNVTIWENVKKKYRSSNDVKYLVESMYVRETLKE